jgi:hypothetical protein
MAEESTVLGDLTGEEFISQAYTLFDEFRQAYESEWTRLNKNESYYLGQHWDNMTTETDDPQPMTPVIFSTVENLEADMVDNYPEAIIRPEAPEDQEIAEIISALIKQNHDAAHYQEEYQLLAHDLLVGGWCCQEVGYDPEMNHGLGGAFIRYVDNHMILFDPQVNNIQNGRAVFIIAPRTKQWLEQKYPEFAGQFAVDSFRLEEDDQIKRDDSKGILQIEVWWKSWVQEGDSGRWTVHMAQMAGRKLLKDSRDEKPDGYFSMGEYPFIVTTDYRRRNSSLGYGIPDMFGKAQEYSDKLDSIVMKNAAMASHNKLLNTTASGFNTDDLRDWSKDVHEGTSLNGLTWFPTPPLPQYVMSLAESVRQSIKEESGANDFSRGNSIAGVTAASSIQLLQDMSSKRSRKLAMRMHEAFKKAVRYEIEFEREFNVLPREVLLTIDGEQRTATFESSMMERQTALGNDIPIEFVISIKGVRENRWQVASHNELMLQMASTGIITPDQTVELMEFEGKEQVLNKSQQLMEQQQQPDPGMEAAAAEQAEIDGRIAQAVEQPQQEALTNAIR